MNTRVHEVKRSIVLAIILLLIGTVVMLYCQWRGTLSETYAVCKGMILAMPFFCVLISGAHYLSGRGIEDRAYMAKMFRWHNADEKRKVYMDYARVLAAAMVILTHACSMQMGESVAAWKTNLLTVCAGLGLACNPLYVMISGALLLSDHREEPIGTFYYRRFVKVVLPMIIYYAVFLCIAEKMSFVPPKNIGEGFLQILEGASDIVPHYWLIYTLISLYILAPFAKIMVKNMNENHINALFVLILVQEILFTMLRIKGVNVGISMDFASWEGVFLLGYIILERRTVVIERLVLTGGMLSAFIIGVVLLQDYSYRVYVCDTTPTMVLFAGAILILLSKCEKWFQNRFAGWISVISGYSYSVILIHWYGLYVVTWGKIGIQPLRFGCVGGILLTVTVTMLVCFVMGFVAENTIVTVVQMMFQRIGFCKGKNSKHAEKE